MSRTYDPGHGPHMPSAPRTYTTIAGNRTNSPMLIPATAPCEHASSKSFMSNFPFAGSRSRSRGRSLDKSLHRLHMPTGSAHRHQNRAASAAPALAVGREPHISMAFISSLVRRLKHLENLSVRKVGSFFDSIFCRHFLSFAPWTNYSHHQAGRRPALSVSHTIPVTASA